MARAIWSGSISFGLVNVPVKIYSAVSPHDVQFRQVEEGTGARIRHRRVSEETGDEVPFDRIVKGFELDDGRLVVISPAEMESAAPEQTRTIDIEDFVELADIDPVYYEKAYYLVPDGPGAEKAYALLTRAMERSGRVALGRFVMRTKQYLAAIRPMDGVLALETMYFADEVRSASELEDAPDALDVSDRELRMADQLIESLTVPWDPGRYEDTYRDRVLDLVARKAEGAEIAPAPAPRRAEVVDLMAALEASLDASRGRRKVGTAEGAARAEESA